MDRSSIWTGARASIFALTRLILNSMILALSVPSESICRQGCFAADQRRAESGWCQRPNSATAATDFRCKRQDQLYRKDRRAAGDRFSHRKITSSSGGKGGKFYTSEPYL